MCITHCSEFGHSDDMHHNAILQCVTARRVPKFSGGNREGTLYTYVQIYIIIYIKKTSRWSKQFWF